MPTPKPDFSYVIDVSDLPREGTVVSFDADAAECETLAKANSLLALKSFGASFRLKPEPRDAVRVTGDVRAVLTQVCVVSLDEFDADLDQSVDVHFMSEADAEAWARAQKAARADEPGLQDEDPPDVISGGKIDLGALAAEFLVLGIDPYPRKPGAEFEAPPVDKDPSPFAALSRLKRDS